MAASEKVLLAIDGDSLAHRAYHALPKSIKSNAILGFTNFLLRLWDVERPKAVLVAWDSLDEPTYRHEALPAYQSGRVFEDSIGIPARFVEQRGATLAGYGGPDRGQDDCPGQPDEHCNHITDVVTQNCTSPVGRLARSREEIRRTPPEPCVGFLLEPAGTGGRSTRAV